MTLTDRMGLRVAKCVTSLIHSEAVNRDKPDRWKATTKLEKRRLALQAALDAGKTQAERNRMGQFSTPTSLAADENGNPLLGRRLFLLNCRLEEEQVSGKYPALSVYLQEGKTQGVAERYLCRHRTPWYAQEDRPPAPFVCTYLGRSGTKRGRPFRFILNHSRATAANVYLMLYPKEPLARVLEDDPTLKRQLWAFLNAICPQAMLGGGRVYGGGLHKLEPKELGNVPAGAVAALLPNVIPTQRERQGDLFGQQN